MIRGKVEAISVSNEEVEIYVMDEDNVSQDIRVDVETLRGERLKKMKMPRFSMQKNWKISVFKLYHFKSKQPLMDLMFKSLR